MKNNILALYDTDITYIQKLAARITKNPLNPFEVHCFTSEDTLLNFLSSTKTDILISPEYLFANHPECSCIPAKICLSSDISKSVDASTDISYIYRHLPASGILSEITGLWQTSDSDIISLSGNTSTRILGFFSPADHEEKTLLALSMGQYLSSFAESLYINLCPFSGLRLFSGSGSLSDLLFSADSPGRNILSTLNQSIVKFGHLGMVSPVNDPYDIIDMPCSKFIKLLGLLTDSKPYRFILVDFGCFFEGFFELFDVCSDIFIPESKGIIGKLSADELRESCVSSLNDKIHTVRIPALNVTYSPSSLSQQLAFGPLNRLSGELAEKYSLVKERKDP